MLKCGLGLMMMKACVYNSWHALKVTIPLRGFQKFHHHVCSYKQLWEARALIPLGLTLCMDSDGFHYLLESVWKRT